MASGAASGLGAVRPRAPGPASASGPSPEQVLAGFNRLRQEQRGLAGKGAELEQEVAEHGLVIDTLAEVDPSRKCYRMVGGVLVERTVKEVLPALENNRQQLVKLIETLNAQIQSKGRELTEYREKYNIRLMNEEDRSTRENDSSGRTGGTGVLVS
ncbi:prefoldin subunit 2 [Leucoraja erinacea]|uniref:prefoldin subunit 2 n=1 Tax=Leucoraja erinaceus TaxID=7782 RepID=UPI002455CCAA|nr:prefoldin subunit 2 [Leucoraja erinacea]